MHDCAKFCQRTGAEMQCQVSDRAEFMCCQLQPMQQRLNYWNESNAKRHQPKEKTADTHTLHPAACQFRFEKAITLGFHYGPMVYTMPSCMDCIQIHTCVMPGPGQHFPMDGFSMNPFVHACLSWSLQGAVHRALHAKVMCGYTVIWREASKIVWMQLLCFHTIQGT